MRILRDKTIEESLRCPICRASMRAKAEPGAMLCCTGERRHCYDFASGGYVNLSLPGQSGGGDSKQAVRARSGFLDLEHYKPISDKMCEIISKYMPSKDSLVIDAGCGEGYYSTAVADKGYSTAGFDLSKFAADAAAKRANRKGLENTFFGVASVFSLPVADGCADCVINVFAPCAEDEYRRILSDNGVLIVVYAGEEHLLGLKKAIYTKAHMNDGRADLPKNMSKIETQGLKYKIKVEGSDNIKNLFAMTPYYWKTSPADSEKLEHIDALETEIDIAFAVYKK